MSERLTKKTSTLTDQLKDISERRRQQAENKFTSGGGPPAHEASDRWLMAVTTWKLSEIADALASLVRERDELQAKWIDADEDAKVQKEFLAVVDARVTVAEAERDELRAQLSVYRAAFDERNKAAEARAEAAEAERDEAREAAYDQPHGPTSRILWSTRYNELLDDYKDERTRRKAAEADAARMREALTPFAREADARAKMALGPDIDDWPIGGSALTLGDLRRARNALGGKDE